MDRFRRIVATPLIGLALLAGCGQRDATPETRLAGGVPEPAPVAPPVSAAPTAPATPTAKAHGAGHERPSRDRPGRERPLPDG